MAAQLQTFITEQTNSLEGDELHDAFYDIPQEAFDELDVTRDRTVAGRVLKLLREQCDELVPTPGGNKGKAVTILQGLRANPNLVSPGRKKGAQAAGASGRRVSFAEQLDHEEDLEDENFVDAPSRAFPTDDHRASASGLQQQIFSAVTGEVPSSRDRATSEAFFSRGATTVSDTLEQPRAVVVGPSSLDGIERLAV